MNLEITTEQINALNAAYAKCIDEDRLEVWPQFFFDDCLYKITSAENYQQGMTAGLMYADSSRMLQDRVTSLREANVYERQRYRHIVGLSSIEGRRPNGVAVESPFLVVRIMRGGKMDLFATGKYVDLVAADADGRLKLVERTVVCDSSSFDTLLAIPL
jgi:3-phenylpropionate/cinnamic acid dioxygenase small subunit